jgi:hypothetical protein
MQTSESTLTIVYGIDGHQINPRTLTASLPMFTEALAKIQSILFPSSEIEISIEPFENGSFKLNVVLKHIGETAKDLAINIFASYIFSLAQPQTPPVITFDKDGAKIEYNGNTTVVPKEKINAYYETRNNGTINGQIREGFSILDNDGKINYMQFVPNNPSNKNPVTVQKENFDKIIKGKEQNSKSEYHNVTVKIESIHKDGQDYQCGFSWNDIKFLAIINNNNIDRFAMKPNKFEIGDELDVRLEEIKSNDYYTDNLIHSDYKIISVYKHIKH